MRQFYLSDPELFNIKIDPFDFKVYEYFCRNYDLKRLKAFVRMVDAADRLGTRMDNIKASLDRLSRITVNYKPLITHKNFTYFEMPRYKYFLESIKFRKNYTRAGWSKIKKNVNTYKNGLYEALEGITGIGSKFNQSCFLARRSGQNRKIFKYS